MGNNAQNPQQRPMSPSKMGPGPGVFPGNQIPPRMMGRGMPMNMPGSPYNGANIQVKASAPNTIQYLPARPQMGSNNPRGPPSIEFLQRFANPMNQMEGNKMPGMGGFYPNQMGPGAGGPQNNDMRMGGGMNHPHMEHMIDGNMGSVGPGGPENHLNSPMEGPMGPQGQGPSSMMMSGGQNSMMMRALRPPNQMRMPPGPPGMMMGGGGPNMPGRGGGNNHMFNGPPNANDHGMFLSGMPNSQQMFGSGPGSMGGKGNRMMGGMPPDGSQQILQNMGGPGPTNVNANNCGPNQQNFKTGQFIGPNANDSRIDESFLKFQQELYATNTNQMNPQQPQSQQPTQVMGNALNQNQQFFGNKKFA